MNLLNRNQLVSLWVGILAVAIMGAMPPWREASGNGNPLGYASITAPPALQSGAGVVVDYARLSIGWIVVAVVTGGLLATFHKVGAQNEERNPGSPTSSYMNVNSQPAGAERAFPTSGIVETSGSKTNAHTGRTLSFPKESMGELLVESKDDPEYWEFFSQASGTVSIPTGRRIQLELIKGDKFDPTAFKNLPPDAFFSIDLSGTRFSDEDLESVKHFSGLRELDLSDTSVTDMGIKSLSGLSKLQKIWLDNTRVTDKGLAELSNHSELAKISLVGTQISKPDAQSVVNAFPHKCELVTEGEG